MAILASNGKINTFVPNAPFLHSLTVFWYFRGVEKGGIENKWVNVSIHQRKPHKKPDSLSFKFCFFNPLKPGVCQKLEVCLSIYGLLVKTRRSKGLELITFARQKQGLLGEKVSDTNTNIKLQRKNTRKYNKGFLPLIWNVPADLVILSKLQFINALKFSVDTKPKLNAHSVFIKCTCYLFLPWSPRYSFTFIDLYFSSFSNPLNF